MHRDDRWIGLWRCLTGVQHQARVAGFAHALASVEALVDGVASEMLVVSDSLSELPMEGSGVERVVHCDAGSFFHPRARFRDHSWSWCESWSVQRRKKAVLRSKWW